MAGIIDSFINGYMSRMGGRGGNNDALAAQNTATAYQRLQDAISQDYSQQKAQAEASGQEWKMPSPTERMQDQIQAMILSGDQNLQSRGLAMLDVPKEDEQSSLEKTAKLLGLTPMQVFDKLHPGAAQTRINVNLPKQDQPMSFEDAQKLDWSQVPGGYQPGMSMMDAGRAGARLAATKDQAESAAQSDVTTGSYEGMKEASKSTTKAPLPAMLSEARSTPGLPGQILNAGLNAANIPQSAADAQFIARRTQAAASITKQLSGTAASDQDTARILGMLPNLGDSAVQWDAKMSAIDQQIKSLQKASTLKGGVRNPVPSAPRAPSAPQQKSAPTKRYNPATGKIEAIQ